MRNLARSIPIGVALFLGLATAAADPPARVGRLSLVQGEVAVHDTRSGESETATLNWPVTGDTAIVTARGARAEVRIGSTAVRLEGATDLEFVQLDDQATLLRLREGTVSVRVRDRETADRFALETPHARVDLMDTGRYRFDANPGAGTTTVTTFQGNAQVGIGGTAVSVASGRRAEIGPQGGMEVVGAFADGFDDWALARDRGDDVARSSRYVSPEMTGAESLDEHGDWRETPDYGAVWVPRAVPVGWAPYRSGRWAWIEPWGWTWIDDAPWGFAPFHYGRWALIGGVWAWAPGVLVARPVYAPALVGWIGHPGWSVTVSFGTVPAVGWFPLAPREVFVPAYDCSTVYVQNVNITHVTNIVHAPRPRRHAHRHVDRAVTVVPASAVTHGHRVDRSQLRARHADLAVGASPPETVTRPPRRASDVRPRDGAPRRPQELARPIPNRAVPAARAATPPQGDRRPIADRSPREERDRRGEPPQRRPEPRGVERGVVRAVPAPQPSPSVALPPARPTGERPAERAAPIARPAPSGAFPPTARAPERVGEQRSPVAVRPDASPRADRGPANERSRAGEPPRRIERRPESTRVQRQVEPVRVPAPMPRVVARPSAPEPRREMAPPRAPTATVRAAPASPQAMLPQRSLPPVVESRGDRGRSEARASRGGESRGGERRGTDRR